MKTARAMVAVAALVVLGGFAYGIGVSGAALDDPPTCTNGDCYGPPVCTNGDCGPPSCTNGDCGDLTDCCCLGPNTEGTVRVCCCPSPNLDGLTCRQSLVRGTGLPDNWHQTLVQETLEGERIKGCEVQLKKFCDPPVGALARCGRGRRSARCSPTSAPTATVGRVGSPSTSQPRIWLVVSGGTRSTTAPSSASQSSHCIGARSIIPRVREVGAESLDIGDRQIEHSSALSLLDFGEV